MKYELAVPALPKHAALAVRQAAAWAPGAALSALIAFAAASVATAHGGPQYLYALLIGVAFHYLSHEPRTAPGIEFCARTVLRLGVGLLGARITAEQIAGLGWTTALVVVAGVATTIVLGLALARLLGLSPAQGVLSGGAVAICGASAALAISAVLPRGKDAERWTLMVVVSVTVLSTVAMVLYPLIATALHLPPRGAGVFIGGTIHDVAQVIGAGYTLGREAGDVSAVVKLFRVALLTLVVVAVSAACRHSQRSAAAHAPQDGAARKKPPLVPWFLWLFVGMVALNSSGLLPAAARQGLSSVSQAFLIVAIAALGMKTSFRQLATSGWKPLALILAETLWLAGLVLACVVTVQR